MHEFKSKNLGLFYSKHDYYYQAPKRHSVRNAERLKMCYFFGVNILFVFTRTKCARSHVNLEHLVNAEKSNNPFHTESTMFLYKRDTGISRGCPRPHVAHLLVS